MKKEYWKKGINREDLEVEDFSGFIDLGNYLITIRFILGRRLRGADREEEHLSLKFT
jgi:hypothetical protein